MVKTDTRTDADKLIDFGLDFLGLWALLIVVYVAFLIVLAIAGMPATVPTAAVIVGTGFCTAIAMKWVRIVKHG